MEKALNTQKEKAVESRVSRLKTKKQTKRRLFILSSLMTGMISLMIAVSYLFVSMTYTTLFILIVSLIYTVFCICSLFFRS